MTELIPLFLLLLLLSWTVVLWHYRATIIHCWREPVLRRPVLVIESDDWGPGPAWHAERLALVGKCLASHHDTDGRPALMTLGVVLGAPDTVAMAQNALAEYRRITLDDARSRGLLEEMQAGASKGVFSLQLHGMEHYWPPALLEAANKDESVRAWLTGDEFPPCEALPSALQSRWVDGSRLPSRPLSPDEIQRAVAEETDGWQLIFGQPAKVVVPPTFVWTRGVETAWVAAGIEVIITPGRRYTRRDATGKPSAAEGPIHNGQRASSEAHYLVRDIYFEPERGHTAARALEDVSQRFLLGRPALVETHRSNFIGTEAQCQQSLERLNELLSNALQRWPGLAFMSPEALARVYADRPRQWCANSVAVRLHVMLRRLAKVSRLRKLARLTGLAVPAAFARILTAGAARRAGVAS